MVSTLAYTARAPGDAAPGPSPLVRSGIAAGLKLLPLPPLVVATVLATEPADQVIGWILAAETLLIAAAQVAIAIRAVRSTPSPGPFRSLIPSLVAGLIVATGDAVSLSFAYGVDILAVFAYDVVLGVAVAAPVVVFLHGVSERRERRRREDIDASPKDLIAAYRAVLRESQHAAGLWKVYAPLTHQLMRRHVRRTLEAIQRGYAERAVERSLNEGEARDRDADADDRKTFDDYLTSVPPMARAVPIPTVASLFLLWQLVPVLVPLGASAAASFSGGDWTLTDVSDRIGGVVSGEVASLVVDALALAIAFPLLMLALMPAIVRRDQLLAEHEVCEREVVLMDDRLSVPRRSRRREYVIAALPALPLALCGGAVLPYAWAGLFVYPSPEGPLGGLVERADLMDLGPVTGAVLAQAFLLMAAIWIAWIVKTRRETRVVFL